MKMQFAPMSNTFPYVNYSTFERILKGKKREREFGYKPRWKVIYHKCIVFGVWSEVYTFWTSMPTMHRNNKK